jgi:hypothetical protein
LATAAAAEAARLPEHDSKHFGEVPDGLELCNAHCHELGSLRTNVCMTGQKDMQKLGGLAINPTTRYSHRSFKPRYCSLPQRSILKVFIPLVASYQRLFSSIIMLESRKRPLPDDGEVAQAKKRVLTSTSGSPEVNGLSANYDAEEPADNHQLEVILAFLITLQRTKTLLFISYFERRLSSDA